MDDKEAALRAELPTYVGVTQAAAVLGVSRDVVNKRMIPRGELRPVGKIGGYRGAWIFSLDEIIRAAYAQTLVQTHGDEELTRALVRTRTAWLASQP